MMIITTASSDRTVQVGKSSYLFCFYSTIQSYIGIHHAETANALSFLKNGQLDYGHCIQTARELNKIRDILSTISPDKVVWDISDSKKNPPWGNNISPVITSLGNYFITADGKDFFFELISLLQYAAESKQNVKIG